ncbi:hypothetical protein AgCh_002425 [Apium graveolens]
MNPSRQASGSVPETSRQRSQSSSSRWGSCSKGNVPSESPSSKVVLYRKIREPVLGATALPPIRFRDYSEAIDREYLKNFHRRRVHTQEESGADLLKFETIPNKLEAQNLETDFDEEAEIIPTPEKQAILRKLRDEKVAKEKGKSKEGDEAEQVRALKREADVLKFKAIKLRMEELKLEEKALRASLEETEGVKGSREENCLC